MKDLLNKKDGNSIFLDIDSSIYSADAILNAMHKFTGKYHVKSCSISTNSIRVIFKGKNADELSLEKISNEFYNELIDQQIRLNVNKEYGNIRDEIVKKAFSPIEL